MKMSQVPRMALHDYLIAVGVYLMFPEVTVAIAVVVIFIAVSALFTSMVPSVGPVKGRYDTAT
jgi:hypothetical protein